MVTHRLFDRLNVLDMKYFSFSFIYVGRPHASAFFPCSCLGTYHQLRLYEPLGSVGSYPSAQPRLFLIQGCCSYQFTARCVASALLLTIPHAWEVLLEMLTVDHHCELDAI
jgi:hypothetical protein